MVVKWIDAHPNTAFLAVADHETGGRTVPSHYGPSLLRPGTHSVEYLSELWNEYNGIDQAAYLSNESIPAYGVINVSDAEINALIAADDGF
jgi:alkaline phosphatase